jgi:hypothetical protein
MSKADSDTRLVMHLQQTKAASRRSGARLFSAPIMTF